MKTPRRGHWCNRCLTCSRGLEFTSHEPASGSTGKLVEVEHVKQPKDGISRLKQLRLRAFRHLTAALFIPPERGWKSNLLRREVTVQPESHNFAAFVWLQKMSKTPVSRFPPEKQTHLKSFGAAGLSAEATFIKREGWGAQKGVPSLSSRSKNRGRPVPSGGGTRPVMT